MSSRLRLRPTRSTSTALKPCRLGRTARLVPQPLHATPRHATAADTPYPLSTIHCLTLSSRPRSRPPCRWSFPATDIEIELEIDILSPSSRLCGHCCLLSTHSLTLEHGYRYPRVMLGAAHISSPTAEWQLHGTPQPGLVSSPCSHRRLSSCALRVPVKQTAVLLACVRLDSLSSRL